MTFKNISIIAIVELYDLACLYMYVSERSASSPQCSTFRSYLLRLNFNLYQHIMAYSVLHYYCSCIIGSLVLIVKDKLIVSAALNQLRRFTVSRIAGTVHANPAAAKLD